MRDPEKTKVGDMRVLARNNFQIVADFRGFTLVEIIMVIILVGIVAVSVVPKLLDTSAFSRKGAIAMVMADIRYGQELAMSSGDIKAVEFDSTWTSPKPYYKVETSTDGTMRTVYLPSGATIDTTVTFTFNALGEPFTNNGWSISISAGGISESIDVAQYTGQVSSS
jgi:prepilin-type N-terminal cleavage/methylation domain-containing protein